MGVLNPSPIRIPDDVAAQPQWLAKLIEEKNPESDILEYKRGGVLVTLKGETPEKILNEFAKDISGMANGRGGIIIFGIAEEKDATSGRKVPTDFAMIASGATTRENLDQRCRASISPAIEGLRIVPITPEGHPPTEECFVFEIPQSDTAHQAKDGKYYRRGNATSEFMQDYEVRECMNRRMHPEVDAEVEYYPHSDEPMKYTGSFHVKLTNHGSRMCQFYQARLTVPIFYEDCVGLADFPEAAYMYPTDRGYGDVLITMDEGVPLFPGGTKYNNFRYKMDKRRFSDKDDLLKNFVLLEVWADDMPCKSRWLDLKDITGSAEEARS